ncbi:MAG TPA: hypothetical protein VHY08_00985 [Bacillota bacterium]|nr:hypothetical protein [Bacillota bacterium]
MKCPQCDNELSEGSTICPTCNESSAAALPPETNIQNPGAPLRIRKTFATRIAKWLIVGGIIYIVIGIANDTVNFIGQLVAARGQNQPFTAGYIALYALGFSYNLLDTTLWGLFFIGLGKIIQILKAGFQHENK